MNATIIETNILIYRNEIEKELKKKGFLNFGMFATDRYLKFKDQEPIYMVCPKTLKVHVLKFSKEDRRFKSQTIIIARPIEAEVTSEIIDQIKSGAKVRLESGEYIPKQDIKVLKLLINS